MACKFISIVYQLYQEMKNEMNWIEFGWIFEENSNTENINTI